MRQRPSSRILGVLGGIAGLAVLGILAFGLARPPAVAAAITEAPQLSAPADGATLATFGPTSQWSNPGGVTQYQFQVTPINNDGPGVNLIIGSPGVSFLIPAPPDWYGLLPDMTYA